ncbi:MAG: hypothetical protein V5A44_10880 [Haloarculaceae archaeon]
MPTKGSGSATAWQEIDEWEGGTGWIAYPDEDMQRASHALEGEDGLYLVDPVSFEGIEEFLADRGEVAGVVLLLDRHKRDAADLANRFRVPVSVPAFMDDVERALDAPVETIGDELPGTGYAVHTVMNNSFWKEAALWDEETGTLLVPEAVGTASFFVAGGERLGVSPALRMTPPKRLRQFDPDRILVGHGPGVFEDASAALEEAISGARRRSPRAFANVVRGFLG